MTILSLHTNRRDNNQTNNTQINKIIINRVNKIRNHTKLINNLGILIIKLKMERNTTLFMEIAEISSKNYSDNNKKDSKINISNMKIRRKIMEVSILMISLPIKIKDKNITQKINKIINGNKRNFINLLLNSGMINKAIIMYIFKS